MKNRFKKHFGRKKRIPIKDILANIDIEEDELNFTEPNISNLITSQNS